VTPWRAWKIYRATRRLLGIFEEGSRMGKPWYKSRTIWVNAISAAAELVGIIPLPGGTALIVANILNIALRFVTTGPAHLIHSEGDQ
tara:strand:+ start:4208 stop:4468 length:261 start_codon:yes stop_codon:yes gene_type:complete